MADLKVRSAELEARVAELEAKLASKPKIILTEAQKNALRTWIAAQLEPMAPVDAFKQIALDQLDEMARTKTVVERTPSPADRKLTPEELEALEADLNAHEPTF